MMDDRWMKVLCMEIKRQTKFGLMAGSDITGAINRGGDLDLIWYSVQSLLIATANVSKLLWPPGNSKYQVQSLKLRKLLEFDHPSPLQDREFRNHFEHYGERIGDWAVSSERRNIVDSNVLPSGAIVGVDLADTFRNLDPNTLSLTFKGERLELKPLIDSLADLHSKSTTAAAAL